MTYLISGERVGLAPLRRELLPEYTRWMNLAEVREGIGSHGFHNEETEAAWYERASTASAERTPSEVAFTVCDLEDAAAVGTTSLFAINHLHGAATFGVMLGERRGRGLGTEAARLTVEWGFRELGLHNIMLTAMAWNAQAIAAYRRAGFEELGVRRNSVWSRGGRADEVYMQVVREPTD